MNGEHVQAVVEEPARLDQFWAENLAHRSMTRGKIQEWIKSGLATVDSLVVRKPSHKLRGGETLGLHVPEICAAPEPEQGGLTVLYRDASLAVVDKPPGLTVHPAPSCPQGTLVNRLLHHFPELKKMDGKRPGIVHRIDKDTTGLLAVALDESARLKLAAAFAGREVHKTYLALIHGRPKRDAESIDAPILRDPAHKTRMAVIKGGREALSSYHVVWTSPNQDVSLVEVTIATGRTHQIRVHMAHIGHPLLGDALYGPIERALLKRRDPKLAKLASRQMLHAWKLGFKHPETGEELEFRCPPPKDFWRVPLYLSRTLQRVGIVGLPGSGKSAVREALAAHGYPVWSADECVAKLYEPEADAWHMLRSRFGDRFVSTGAPVDKKALLAAMRGSEVFRREFMELLYPMVMHQLEDFWEKNARSRAGFAEIPMLLEAGWLGKDVVDAVVGVRCPAALRRERLAAKRGWDQDMIALVESWQWPEEKKLAACGHVIDNSGCLADVARAVNALLPVLQKERTSRPAELIAWMRSQGYA